MDPNHMVGINSQHNETDNITAMELDAEQPAILLGLVLKPLRLSICAARNCESLTEDAISCRNLCVT